jgi:predicted AAA+ superfamily ATPase
MTAKKPEGEIIMKPSNPNTTNQTDVLTSTESSSMSRRSISSRFSFRPSKSVVKVKSMKPFAQWSTKSKKNLNKSSEGL